MEKKAALVILDGWGIGDGSKSDAISKANTPFINYLCETNPNSQLITYGEVVGLPHGQMGNSEVGHLNIGAGRTVYQDLLKINNAFSDGSFFTNQSILSIKNYCLDRNKALHILGLASDGGVHSNINHIIDSAKYFDRQDIKVCLHLFTDGRDTDPHSGLAFVQKILQELQPTNVEVATICGRYYAMDRDKRWERTKIAYDLLVNGMGTSSSDFLQSIQESYDKEVSDEFLQPIFNENLPKDQFTIKDEDAIFFANFRTDRPRQLTAVLSQEDRMDFGMKRLDCHFSTMTEYDQSFQGLNIIYPKENIQGTLGELISKKGKKQLRAAETEKYPHVTFFFNGGREQAFEGEERILANSPKVATYDLQPEMSAEELTERCIAKIEADQADFVCINYANADMVGHTGDYDAVIKACETLDQCLKKLIYTFERQNYSVLIIADHGNADYMINEDGSANTAHTKNPVPCILIHSEGITPEIRNGNLTDIAPTILKLMEIEKGDLMTGKALF